MSLILLAAASAILLVPPASAQLPVYKCLGPQRILTNYAGIPFRLDLTPTTSSFLQPNMNCSILIMGNTTSRWLITMDTVSLDAFNAEFVIQDGGIDGKPLISATANGTSIRQIATNSNMFNVRLTTKLGPVATAFGVKMTIEVLVSSSCPGGWYSPLGSSSYCYGVPNLVGNLTFNEAAKGCNQLLSNLAMGNFDYDSISSELRSAPASMLNPRLAYWVGMYETEGAVLFLNKYNSLDSVSGNLCSRAGNCNCIAFQNGQFYRDDCNSLRPYICYMPKGGTSAYYNINSLESATGSAVITIVAILLTVGFVLTVIVCLSVAVVCCLRRAAVRRQSRQVREAAGGTAGFASYPAPPPYPLSASAPPYTVVAASHGEASAPAYTMTGCANAAFVDVGGAEKPPAYSAEWSGHQVPA